MKEIVGRCLEAVAIAAVAAFTSMVMTEMNEKGKEIQATACTTEEEIEA